MTEHKSKLEAVGFIGLGIMGLPMVRNLLKEGIEVLAYDLNQASLDAAIADGAKVATSAQVVAQERGIIITMLPDTPDVEAVLFGQGGVAEGVSAGKLIIDMSSISPEATVDFASRINDLDCTYLDAPVSGGEGKAITGEMTIMVGGPEDSFNRAQDAFNAMGATVSLIGTRNGDGQVCKVANQIIVGVTTCGVAEALLFAAKSGADPKMVRQALMGGAANSMILENHGQRMLDRNFDPTFRASLQRKDLGLAVDGAGKTGIYLPQATSAWQIFNACLANGDGDMDSISILKVLEQMAGYKIEETS